MSFENSIPVRRGAREVTRDAIVQLELKIEMKRIELRVLVLAVALASLPCLTDATKSKPMPRLRLLHRPR